MKVLISFVFKLQKSEFDILHGLKINRNKNHRSATTSEYT